MAAIIFNPENAWKFERIVAGITILLNRNPIRMFTGGAGGNPRRDYAWTLDNMRTLYVIESITNQVTVHYPKDEDAIAAVVRLWEDEGSPWSINKLVRVAVKNVEESNRK